jgi:sodium pump decarboxylase gamma subunit
VAQFVQDLWQGLAPNLGEFRQGITVTVLGMGLVFAALGMLMLIIAGLQIVFRAEPAPARPLPPRPLPPVSEGEGENLEEVAAAIAVAITALRRRAQPSRPPETTVITLEPSANAWRALGRLS